MANTCASMFSLICDMWLTQSTVTLTVTSPRLNSVTFIRKVSICVSSRGISYFTLVICLAVSHRQTVCAIFVEGLIIEEWTFFVRNIFFFHSLHKASALLALLWCQSSLLLNAIFFSQRLSPILCVQPSDTVTRCPYTQMHWAAFVAMLGCM